MHISAQTVDLDVAQRTQAEDGLWLVISQLHRCTPVVSRFAAVKNNEYRINRSVCAATDRLQNPTAIIGHTNVSVTSRIAAFGC